MVQVPLILAVETSGRLGSVAVALGEQVLGETCFSGQMKHSSELFPAVSGLLTRSNRKPNRIEHIYISVGPGSFTGLRIAVALAKAMHFANGAKIVPVDTLDVIAANATDFVKGASTTIDKFATVLDAKRGQFYVAVYKHQQGKLKKIVPDCLMTARQFLDRFAGNAKPIWLLGEGLVYHRDDFKGENIHFIDEDYWNPRAAKVHSLGWQLALKGRFVDPFALQPNYLLRPEAEMKIRSRL
ncbi:MAG: tRNA (adenosine(37)-N6)-threonylcarbamoyltransferase complex dimerization subunit type 1 TsaB [Planctomycetota bacterium]|jgi:tRNA threonylcarbamoyladenosine biosynthesis protein TsaB